MLNRPKLSSPRSRYQKSQKGSSLIEVLVAMLIASVGVMAMAGLLGTATRFAKTAEYRSMATMLAADIADRIRANRAGEAVYSLTNVTLKTAGVSNVTCANVNLCSFTELANQDMAAWEQTLFNSLPSGTGYINRSDAANHMFDIWIIWEDPDALSTGAFSNAFDSSDATAAGLLGCPPGFSVSDKVPRCMYFRVGL